ncbi:MAG TPA: TlpA disulfide reductase family protein [Candidatus Acidoferrum sp.]|jgi:thiol-disulfide isomerase/thioredoxin|nr:TlpA disulfide reductase family protein [Candidatus Acidoferrum sp.]
MNSRRCGRRALVSLWLALALLGAGLPAPQTQGQDAVPSQRFQPAEDEFSALARSVAALLQSRDTARFAKEVTPSPEDWTAIASTNEPEADEALKSFIKGTEPQRKQTETSAKAFLARADSLHLDFAKGDLHARAASPKRIGTVHFNNLQPEGTTLPRANEVEIILKPDALTNHAAGAELKLVLRRLSRFPAGWRAAGGMQWETFPEGIVDENTRQETAMLDTAEQGTLPPGRSVPEIEFTALTEQQKLKLSSLRGKVVVLDFWATWCGPCQRPMAELQKLKQRHPDWGDRVAIVPLSIDDTLEAVRQHVNQRGWTNTFNVWAGDGGWRSAPARAFHVSGVPTTYIIDAQGKIVVAGHPAAMNIDNQVDAALKKE